MRCTSPAILCILVCALIASHGYSDAASGPLVWIRLDEAHLTYEADANASVNVSSTGTVEVGSTGCPGIEYTEVWLWAISDKGAKGLMQILPLTAEEIAREADIVCKDESVLHNPFINIQMGTYYLSKLEDIFQDIDVGREYV